MNDKGASHPRRLESQYRPSAHGDGAVFVNVDGRDLLLGALEARLWMLCDGTRSPADIAQTLSDELQVDVPRDVVWRAVDSLADASLLTARVAPPAGRPSTNRRDFLRRAVPGVMMVGAAAAVMPLAAPAEASAEEDAKQNLVRQEQADKLRSQEQADKLRSQEQADKFRSQEQADKASGNPSNPMPAPATLVLFGTALAALAATRYGKKPAPPPQDKGNGA